MNNSFQITTERLRLSLPQDDDANPLLEFHQKNRSHLEQWEPLREVDIYQVSYWADWISRANDEFKSDQSMRLILRLRESNEIIGLINFTNFERGPFQNCRLGYKLGKSFEGHGFMTEALKAGIDEIKAKRFHRIEANYIPHNEKSGALLKRLNFTHHGIAPKYLKIAGKWQDHCLTSLILENLVD